MTGNTAREEELARRVECPVCGAPPGASCRAIFGGAQAAERSTGSHPERVLAAAENPPHDLDLGRNITATDPPRLTLEEVRQELEGIRQEIRQAGRLVPVTIERRLQELNRRLDQEVQL